MNLEETENLKKFIQDEFLTGSKNAIEGLIFLYFHKEKVYPDKEIWENIKDLAYKHRILYHILYKGKRYIFEINTTSCAGRLCYPGRADFESGERWR